MMDKVLLGLLSKKEMTVYAMKVAMDKSISYFYSNSFGSINPAIKKLEKQELIRCTESIEKSRLKKTYSISNKGKEVYKEWIAQPIEQGRIKDEVLIRVFFLGDSNEKEREKLLKEYLKVLEESKKDLEKRKEEIAALNLSEEDKEKVKFQLATLQFGIDYFDFKRKWLKNLAKDI